MKRPGEYPPIADYALIGDCHSAALVSRQGSIDWCCLPRFDSDSCFGRLLDWSKGGYFQISPAGRCSSRREYLEKSLVLVTTFRAAAGEARLIDFGEVKPWIRPSSAGAYVAVGSNAGLTIFGDV